MVRAVASVPRLQKAIHKCVVIARHFASSPNKPCNTRNSTISTRDCAMPHSMEATVKPATATRNRRLRPNRPARKPVGGVMIAAATMYEVSTQLI